MTRPTIRDWLSALVIVFRLGLRPWDGKGGWIASIAALEILAIPVVLVLGLTGVLP